MLGTQFSSFSGIFYHSSNESSNSNIMKECMIFWSLDIILDTLDSLTYQSLYLHNKNILTLLEQYFPTELAQYVKKYINEI